MREAEQNPSIRVSNRAGFLFAACKVSGVTTIQKMVLIMLADRCDDFGKCYPGRQRLAEDCCCSLSAVKRALSDLHRIGLIAIESRYKDGKQIRNDYTLNIQKIQQYSEPGDCFAQAENDGSEGVQREPPGQEEGGQGEPPKQAEGVQGEPPRGFTVSRGGVHCEPQNLPLEPPSRNSYVVGGAEHPPTREKYPALAKSDRADHYRFAARQMWDLIQPLTKQKSVDLESWSDTIRLIVERDGYPLKVVGDAFRWANADDFWQSNILSAKSLRKQMPKLVAKLNSSVGGAKSTRKRTIAEDMADTSWAT